jgi:hypothetical protein
MTKVAMKTKNFQKTLKDTCAQLGIKPTMRVVFVCIDTQTLQLFDGGKLARSYEISTSRRAPSNVRDSMGTPRGLHEIAERLGAGQPSGMIFKARRPTGRLCKIETRRPAAPDPPEAKPGALEGRDKRTDNKTSYLLPNARKGNEPPTLITTRILWLRGLEQGVNLGGYVDSHDRYIYIHGTNREDMIGTPQSAGCVVMRNLDIIELYDHVRAGDMVLVG